MTRAPERTAPLMSSRVTSLTLSIMLSPLKRAIQVIRWNAFPSFRRHGRACPGHPRLSRARPTRKDVDARDKRGHDGERGDSISSERTLNPIRIRQDEIVPVRQLYLLEG